MALAAPTALASYGLGDFGEAVDDQSSSAAASSQGIEWLQVGIGLGTGIALVLGLGLAIRLIGMRPATQG
jgi:hypothetical protein